MKIICKKEVRLMLLNSILELEKHCDRIDIGGFLRNKVDSEDPIDKNVRRNLLYPMGLLDIKGKITEEGEKVRDTNRIWLREKGEYAITQIIDPLYRRVIDITPSDIHDKDKGGSHTPINSTIPKGEFISFRDIDRVYRTLRKTTSFSSVKNLDKRLRLNWELSLEEKDTITLEDINYGLDSNLDFQDSKDFDTNTFLKELGEKNGFSWNRELEALEVNFKYAESNDGTAFNIKKFIAKEKNLDISRDRVEFDSVNIENLKVMPNSETEAEKWYIHNLIDFVSKEYRKPTDFNNFNNNQLKSKYLRHYLRENMGINEFTKHLKSLGKDKFSTFWNLQAPLDLSFDTTIQNRKLIVGKPGEKITISMIVGKLRRKEEIEGIILFDQHILTDSTRSKDYLRDKYRFLNEFLNALGEDVTLEVYTKRRALDNLECLDSLNNNIQFSVNGALDKHPRNLIFIYKDGNYDIWRLDRTIDLIKYPAKDFDKDTPGCSRNFSIQNMNISTLDDFTRSIVEGRLR